MEELLQNEINRQGTFYSEFFLHRNKLWQHF